MHSKAQSSTRIVVAETDDDINRCYPVLVQLRPRLEQLEFVQRVRRMQDQGFRLVYLAVDDRAVAVAGYRVVERLFLGGLGLYVDDLVTDGVCRSCGHGSNLLRWLFEEGKRLGCCMVELDSAVQRVEAHRFYFRERMKMIGYHFAHSIELDE